MRPGRPFAELLQYYAMERFLYRLSWSEYKDRLVLKGALMFVAWGTPRSRATKDIDLLARTDNSIANLAKVVQSICGFAVLPSMAIQDRVALLAGRDAARVERPGRSKQTDRGDTSLHRAAARAGA